MFLFGFTRQFASLFTTKGSSAVSVCSSLPSVDPTHDATRYIQMQNNTLTIILAVFSIYLIDFSINAGV
jgi:hypothetical protein